jgi:large subunit ribosomal protein L23
MKNVTLTPRFSEKAYNMSIDPKNTVVVFEVNADANKLDVKRAVEAEHKVTVTNVRITNRKPKAYQRMVSKRSRAITVNINGHKKAYVTLKAGDKISLFGEEAAVEAPKKDTTAVIKKADKPAIMSVAGKLNSVVKRAGGSRGGDK